EFTAASLAHRVRQFAVVIGKEQKWRAAGGLFAHEQQGDLRREKLKGDRGLQGSRLDERGQTLAECTVADLIVILQEQHVGGCRKLRGGAAARRTLVLRILALECPA